MLIKQRTYRQILIFRFTIYRNIQGVSTIGGWTIAASLLEKQNVSGKVVEITERFVLKIIINIQNVQ